MKTTAKRLCGILLTLVLLLTCLAAAFPSIGMRVNAASVDYPAVLARISTYDNTYPRTGALPLWVFSQSE